MNEHMKQSCSDYLMEAFKGKERREMVARAKKILKNLDFDAIAFRGFSGAIMAPAIADSLKKEIILIRKPSDRQNQNSHADQMVEGYMGEFNYIIVDDFVSSGHTVDQIIEGMQRFSPEAKCVGIYLYRRPDEMSDKYEGIPLLNFKKRPEGRR